MNHPDFYPTSSANIQSHFPDTTTTAASTAIALLVGFYVIFKGLESSGFPVWLWLHSLLLMAQDTISSLLSISPIASREAGDAETDGEHPDNMQASRGGVLRKVFGLDGPSILKSNLGDRSLRSIGTLLKGTPSGVPAGLGNWDNSCYQNSVLQGLASLPSLKQYLSQATTRFSLPPSDTTNGTLFELINKLNNPENHGQRLWTPAKLKSMSSFQQQDAQEYYSRILDDLDKEVLKASRARSGSTSTGLLEAEDVVKGPDGEKQQGGETTQAPDTSSLQNPLDGLLAQRVGCIKCGYTEGLSLIPFNCLTVPLGRQWMYDVRECLDSYTELEYIEGVECPKCTLLRTKDTLSGVLEKAGDTMPEVMRSNVSTRLAAVEEALEDDDFADNTLIKKCQVPKKNWSKTTKSRQAVVARAPKCLVIHVNRSLFDEYTGALQKNHAQVAFPRDLDLGTWCLGSRPSQSQHPDEATEEWVKDPKESMLSSEVVSSPFQYGLTAAITHYGRHENGHYICYRKHPFTRMKEEARSEEGSEEEKPKERWWCLSDDDVSTISEEEVLTQDGVFMLFYERIDQSAPSPPSHTSKDTPTATIEDAPLPPSDTTTTIGLQDSSLIAAGIPLPADDDLEDGPNNHSPPPSRPSPEVVEPSSPPTAPPLLPPETDISPPLPSPSLSPSEAETQPYDSEDTPSTQMTSEDDISDTEVKPSTPIPPKPETSPMLMRTAGAGTGRRESALRMVAAT